MMNPIALINGTVVDPESSDARFELDVLIEKGPYVSRIMDCGPAKWSSSNGCIQLPCGEAHRNDRSGAIE